MLLSQGTVKGRSSPDPLKLAAYSTYISLSSKWFCKLPRRSKCHAFFRYLNLCFVMYNLTALLVETKLFWREISWNESMVIRLLMHLSPQINSKTHANRGSGGMQMVLIEVKITVLVNHNVAQRSLFDWSRVFFWDVEPIFSCSLHTQDLLLLLKAQRGVA